MNSLLLYKAFTFAFICDYEWDGLYSLTWYDFMFVLDR